MRNLGLGLGLTRARGIAAPFTVTLTGLTDGEARIGDHASIGFTIDPDNGTEAVKWSNSSNPADAATYGTGSSPTDYTAGDGGSLWLHVTDGGETVSRNAPIRYAPGTLSIGNQSAWTVNDTDVDIDASASGANLTFSNYAITGVPAGISINSSTGQITGTPTEEGSGTATVTCQDQYGRQYSDDFTWSTQLRAQATGGTDLDLSFPEDSAITSTDLVQNWTDNGNTLTFVSVSPSLPAGLSIDSDGVMTGTPTTATADDTYTLTMEDEYGRETSDDFTLEITSAATAPELTQTSWTDSTDTLAFETDLGGTVYWALWDSAGSAPTLTASGFTGASITESGDAGSISSGSDDLTPSYTATSATADRLSVGVVTADDGISNVLTNTFVPNLAPEAFVDADWSVATGASTGGQLDVTIASLPEAYQNAITDIEYELDASGTWVSSGGTGNFTITGLTASTSYDVRLRAVNADGTGAAGNTETATSSAAGSGGLPFTDDFSTQADNTDLATTADYAEISATADPPLIDAAADTWQYDAKSEFSRQLLAYAGQSVGADQYAQAVITNLGTDNGDMQFLIVRESSGAHYRFQVRTGASNRLYYVDSGGTPTELVRPNVTIANGDTVRLEVTGTDGAIAFEVLVNGVSQWTGGTPSAGQYINSGRPGMGLQTNSGATTSALSSVEFGEVA